MGDSYAISTLTTKRAKIAGLILDLEKQLADYRPSLMHIDAVLKLLDPSIKLSAIRAKGRMADRSGYFDLGENFFRKMLEFVDGGFQLELRFFDDRINDVGLVAGVDFAADTVPHAGEMLLVGEMSFDGGAAGREFVEDGDVEIAVESERKRAGNGRGGEDEDVRSVAVGGGFVHEALALEDAEAVLLVDGDEA